MSQQSLGLKAPYAQVPRERVGQLGDHRIQKRHARLERMGHAHPIGLHEQIVDQVGPQVDILQSRQRLGALGLGEPGAVRLQWVDV